MDSIIPLKIKSCKSTVQLCHKDISDNVAPFSRPPERSLLVLNPSVALRMGASLLLWLISTIFHQCGSSQPGLLSPQGGHFWLSQLK